MPAKCVLCCVCCAVYAVLCVPAGHLCLLTRARPLPADGRAAALSLSGLFTLATSALPPPQRAAATLRGQLAAAQDAAYRERADLQVPHKPCMAALYYCNQAGYVLALNNVLMSVSGPICRCRTSPVWQHFTASRCSTPINPTPMA